MLIDRPSSLVVPSSLPRKNPPNRSSAYVFRTQSMIELYECVCILVLTESNWKKGLYRDDKKAEIKQKSLNECSSFISYPPPNGA